MASGTLGTIDEYDEMNAARWTPVKQHLSSDVLAPTYGQQVALAPDESPRLIYSTIQSVI